jgi:hypothetical protein
MDWTDLAQDKDKWCWRLWMLQWTSRYKMWGISAVAEELSAYEERLGCMEVGSYLWWNYSTLQWVMAYLVTVFLLCNLRGSRINSVVIAG